MNYVLLRVRRMTHLVFPLVGFFVCLSLLLGTFTVPFGAAHAQAEPTEPETPCGDIIIPADTHYFGQEAQLHPIEDCDNPFGADTPAPFEYSLTLALQAVTAGAEITVVEGESVEGSFSMSKTNSFVPEPLGIFRQEGNDFHLVALIGTQDFSLEPLQAGEYVAVFSYEDAPMFMEAKPLWKQWLQSWFMPATAHAAYLGSAEVAVVPFTITYSTPTPTGASSVLFLPGVMGSRLFEESDACGKEIKVRERWLSRDDCDQLRLKSNFLGKSINEIFTNTKESGVIDEILGFNLYKSFLGHLAELKEEGIIHDYTALPYDWRLMLKDVANSAEIDGKVFAASVENIQDGLLYKTIEELAAESLSGKVTIVAHSNGGLLSKYFLDTLEKQHDPLLSKIDNLFLAGVPQSGSPEAIVSILHGTELGQGFVLDQETARELVNLMPSIHHLLPSEKYYEGKLATDFPVIQFLPGELTSKWADAFGETVTTMELVRTFLSKESGREKPAPENLLQPEVADKLLLDYAAVTHELQSAWHPPENVNVYQLAGTGVLTTVGITYFTDLECTSRSVLQVFRCNEHVPKLGYRITKIDSGDGTVPFPSAMAMQQGSRVHQMIVDLFEYNDANFFDRVHRNILEISDVQDYIQAVLTNADEVEYDYLSKTLLPSQTEQRIVFQLHSPLDMKLIAGGQELSSSTREIKNGVYERFGEVQYISVPRAIGDFELILTGLAEGSFTLDIEEWQGNEMKQRNDFVAVPSTFGTKVVLSVTESDALPRTFTIDYDGDGEVDAVVSEDGSMESLSVPEVETVEAPVVTEERPRAGTSGTRVSRPAPVGQVAGVTTLIKAEDRHLQELAVLLTELSRLLTLLGKMSV